VRFAYTWALSNTPPRPYLDVILRNGFATTPKLMALVDSGADYSIFPMEVARELHLDLTQGDVWRFSGTTGKIQEASLANVSLAVLMENDVDYAFELHATCPFCDTFQFAGGVLLGQNGFFSRFRTTFRQPENCFDIELWEPAE
jgi:hypothetical protein